MARAIIKEMTWKGCKLAKKKKQLNFVPTDGEEDKK